MVIADALRDPGRGLGRWAAPVLMPAMPVAEAIPGLGGRDPAAPGGTAAAGFAAGSAAAISGPARQGSQCAIYLARFRWRPSWQPLASYPPVTPSAAATVTRLVHTLAVPLVLAIAK